MHIFFRNRVDNIFRSDSGIVKKLLAGAVVGLSISVAVIAKKNSEGQLPEDNLGVGGSILATVVIVVIVTGVVALMNLSDIAKDKALKDYSEAIRLNPDHANAYYKRGALYTDKGEFDLAIKDYSEAIRLKPDDPDFYNNRGVTHQKNGDQSKADADFAKARELRTKK